MHCPGMPDNKRTPCRNLDDFAGIEHHHVNVGIYIANTLQVEAQCHELKEMFLHLKMVCASVALIMGNLEINEDSTVTYTERVRTQLRSQKAHYLTANLNSPTADSPGYVPEFDSEEDPEEDPADGDDEDESSDDDEDDDDFLLGEDVEDLLALSSPPPSPLFPWSSPLPQIPTPPLPVSSSVPVSPLPLPASPTYPLGYRAAMIRQRAEAPSTSHPITTTITYCTSTYQGICVYDESCCTIYLYLSILIIGTTIWDTTTPTYTATYSTPTMLLPHLLNEEQMFMRLAYPTLPHPPPRKRLCFAFGSRYEVGKSSFAPTATPYGDFRRDYGFIATLDDGDYAIFQREMNG
ncbi:hypothetical protein Tco_0958449 [Tanacetum coccineum]